MFRRRDALADDSPCLITQLARKGNERSTDTVSASGHSRMRGSFCEPRSDETHVLHLANFSRCGQFWSGYRGETAQKLVYCSRAACRLIAADDPVSNPNPATRMKIDRLPVRLRRHELSCCALTPVCQYHSQMSGRFCKRMQNTCSMTVCKNFREIRPSITPTETRMDAKSALKDADLQVFDFRRFQNGSQNFDSRFLCEEPACS